ncbi:hypothetical protein [Burkholderia sp. Ax-1719]|uniref:hypothetical protein n=1 Tax=Burkholderia sp. Ax-1719 TaxID=2608334 RepID=UPI00141DBC4A|nr:hypothetical protein [Burkholderia sp. Ax-1719]NIE63209.1 hypothetical protein [Burkholderia sp. Ax-1719]
MKGIGCTALLSALMLCSCAAPQHSLPAQTQLVPLEDAVAGSDGELVRAIRQSDSQAAEAAIAGGANVNLKLCYVAARPGYIRYGVFGQDPTCRPASRMQPTGVPLLEVVLDRARVDAQPALVSALGRHGAKWDMDGLAVLGQLTLKSYGGQINWDVRLATAKALISYGFQFSPVDIRTTAHTEAEFHRTASLAFVGQVARLSGNSAAFDAEIATRNEERQKLAEEKAIETREAVKQDRVVGTEICRTDEGISRQILGTAFGRPMYGQGVRATYRIVGFTEGVTPDKIKIRINSIKSIMPGGSVENIEHLDGDPHLDVNGVIYDTPLNWQPCG